LLYFGEVLTQGEQPSFGVSGHEPVLLHLGELGLGGSDKKTQVVRLVFEVG
jgi:hypothetical protein